jgi:U3 small nucleolar ribonucleoprotein protein LCP5
LFLPENGNTLFDTKNEIFLSYLQALALRNLNVIRSIKNGDKAEETQKLSEEITKKLVEHRVYLERGVKPLELKLKYQVDRVVKAADDQERAAAHKAKQTVAARSNSTAKATSDDDSEDDSESDSDAELGADMTAYQPNLKTIQSQTAEADTTRRKQSAPSDGVYRPPRVSATSMPTTERREPKAERKPHRSATLDEYVSTELSTAPLAEPSIGSNLASGGRQTKSARNLREEAERRDYEETNLVRLPVMSKKERARKGLGKATDGGFGGEEWRGLGANLDRIGDLTKRKGKDSQLDKSRKRRMTEDGPRGDGVGGGFEVKKRRMQKKGQL